MKKILLIGVFILIFSLQISNVNALSLEKNDFVLSKGQDESVNISIDVEDNVKEVEFYLVYSSYDIIGSFVCNSNLSSNLSGSKYTVKLSEVSSGNIGLGTIKIKVSNSPNESNGTINLYKATALTEDGNRVNLNSQLINVRIGEENTSLDLKVNNNDESTNDDNKVENDNQEVDKNLLKEINSKFVEIRLEKDVFEYDVFVDETIEELDLIGVPIDDSYEVEISNQRINKLENDQILIRVKFNDMEQIYKINVKRIEIDNEKTNVNANYKGIWSLILGGLIVLLVIGVILIKRK